MPKLPGLLILPVLNLGFAILLAWVPRLDPRLRRDPAADTTRFRRLLRRCRWLITGQMALAEILIVLTAVGWAVDVGRVLCDSFLLVIAVLGNFFGNLPSNYLFGARTPWTLEDPATWRATHRLVGRAMVFGAAGLLIAGCFMSTAMLTVSMLAFIVSLGFGSLGYSAWHYRRQRA